MSQSTRGKVLNAAEDLRESHGRALGAIEAEIERLRGSQGAERRKVEAEADRQQLITKTKASNTVMAAQFSVRSSARAITDQPVSETLRVAEYVELGELAVNARAAGINSQLDVPLMIPLLGHGGVNILGSGESSNSLMRNVQLVALEGTAAGQLGLVSYDPDLANPLAPFASIGTTIEGGVRTLQSKRELDNFLDEASKTIARIGNLLMGSPGGLIEHRTKVGLPVEQYTLVSLHNYPAGIDEAQHERLVTLARSGPRYGLSVVFHVPNPHSVPEWLRLADLRNLGESFEVANSRIIWGRKPDLMTALPDVTTEEAAAKAEFIAQQATKAASPVLPFKEIQPSHGWGESSKHSVTFAVGRAGTGIAELTLGDERVNAVITGAVGQGKSNLLKVIIHSLASRYSPDELSLYLLDMKEGVTLAPMAPSSDSPSFLPHARVLGLEADKDFGLSVLNGLLREYKRRSKLMKVANVEKLADLREHDPSLVLPRIVLMVDEFHLLLGDDEERIGKQAVKALEQVVRLGRSSGIHVILASQSISGISNLLSAAQGIFAQFPIRLGLKNSAKEALAFFGHGNDAISKLRYRGEAILNLDYGDVESNQTVMIAAADDKDLSSLRDGWHSMAGNAAAPLLFDGSQASNLVEDCGWLVKARETVQAGGAPRIFLGKPVSVTPEPITFAFEPNPGRNLAIVGSGSSSDALGEWGDDDDKPTNAAIGVLQAAGISLATQHKPGTVEFVVLDLLTGRDREQNNNASWLQHLRELGHEIEVILQADVKNWIIEESKRLAVREAGAPMRYVLGFSFDRVGPIETRDEATRITPSKELQNLLRQGPTLSEHFLIWWSDPAQFVSHLDRKVDPFNGSVLLQGVGEALTRFHGTNSKWSETQNRALFGDATSSAGKQKIIPYQPLTEAQLTKLQAEVTRDHA